MRIELWTINRILRYTGFRLCIEIDPAAFNNTNTNATISPTKIGLIWYGWKFLFEK